ncbi:MAG TPA: S41 family peptidase [Gemmatimonadaceae bacterium]|nr:S41 family peptidase [Gemmatimonadaceae bacterium]
MSARRYALAVAVHAALAVAATTAAAAQAAPDTAPKKAVRARTTYEDMQMFSQVLNQIRVNHPDSIDTHELMMAAVRGMVAAADPHSFVMEGVQLTPEKQRALEDGKLIFVPIEFQFIEGTPVVTGVAPGTEAAQQDILVGDVLLAADSVAVNAESEMELQAALAGKKNTTVRLTFERRRVDGSVVAIERVVRRERVGDNGTAIPAAFMLDARTGYVRVTTFDAEHVGDDLHAAIGRLESQGMQRLILDLRDNGGGRVKEAAQVAGEFLPSGTIVYTSEGRKHEVTDTGRVSRSFWKSERRFPLIVMINDGTASASELVAGALQDHDRALIVGQPSFGKALLMAGFQLSDGSTIELVIGHVKTPCGRVIQRQYHGMSRREYFRLSHADRDTAGRPWCRTDDGRVVYGGGGIYPDIRFPWPKPEPLWFDQLSEEGTRLKFLNGYVSANPSLFPSLDALAKDPRLPPDAVTQLRAFAARDSLEIPAGAEADSILQRSLVRGYARFKWGDAGYYRMAAIFDPEVARAAASFDKAQQILGAPH